MLIISGLVERKNYLKIFLPIYFVGIKKPSIFAVAKKGLYLQNAEIAQLVEHNLAKVGVASSSLVFRSRRCE